MGRLFALVATCAVLVSPKAAGAFEAWEGRIQLHGFTESVWRVLNNDFSDDYDVAQMQFILNLEIEVDIAPDGIGPATALSAFSRVEVRYDCVWTRGCTFFDSMDAYGNHVNGLPEFRTNGKESPWTGTAFGNPRKPEVFRWTRPDGTVRTVSFSGARFHENGQVIKVEDAGPFETFFEATGPDQVRNTPDDPGSIIFGDLGEYRMAIRETRGSQQGIGTQVQLPLRPMDRVTDSIGLFRFVPNFLSPIEENPSCRVSSAHPPAPLDCTFRGALRARSSASVVHPVARGDVFSRTPVAVVTPYRPWPSVSTQTAKWMFDDNNIYPKDRPLGLYFPSPGLQRFLREENIASADQNFSQLELAFNHGASQQDEGELKELYIDVEFFDGRLWIRLGKQTIVWGKTELFRNQDQFNPVDIALATLASLEESRIALWSARAVWSFYDVGPLEDVRLELAMIFDDFEPDDLGRCGEPFSPLPVFGLCLGLIAHGAAGLGLAGEVRPPDPWSTTRGIQGGARLEFRWRRFSFAITDFYGYGGRFTEPIFKYSRNVDPLTGRPRRGMSDKRCDPEGLYGPKARAGCLGNPSGLPPSTFPEGLRFSQLFSFASDDRVQAVNERVEINRERNTRAANFGYSFFDRDDEAELIPKADKRAGRESISDIILNSPVNQTLFHLACAGTIGFTDLVQGLESECGFGIFSSQVIVPLSLQGGLIKNIPVVEGIGQILSGGFLIYKGALAFILEENPDLFPPVVPLNSDDCGTARLVGLKCTNARVGEGAGAIAGANTSFLTILSPGISQVTTPEQQGLLGCGAFFANSCDRDGMNLMWAEASAVLQSFPGFDGTPMFGFTTQSGPQPGTLGFQGGPVCTRFERGKTYILPGCRGPEDPGYDPSIDGHPFFDAQRNAGCNPATGVCQKTTVELGGQIFDVFFSDIKNFAEATDCPQANNLEFRVGRPTTEPGGTGQAEAVRMFHPFTCAPFRSEMSAMSFNLLMLTVLFSTDGNDGGTDQDNEIDGFKHPGDFDEFNPKDPFNPNRCSIAAPQFCSATSSLLGATGVLRNTINAGGNFAFGRRDFTWHGGSELVLRYQKQNVLGFSMDFAEDWSKTNWGVEFTWTEGVQFTDNDAVDTLNQSDVYQATISVDRPTFINFLNANRTVFFNSQWFIRYVPDHTQFFTADGPWRVLATFTTITGYFQDRLLTVLTIVYDFPSNSGAGLPSITYRFSERFSATFGMAFFFGREAPVPMSLMPAAIGNRKGTHAYKDFVENGISPVRDRDEFFFRIRLTF